MKFSPTQDAALKAVSHWYRHESKKKQTFKLFGWAGTGKTTLARHFAEDINGTVKYACFTGKAAHVMAQKGCVGASTIHRLIYTPKMQSRERLNKLEDELEKLKAEPEPQFNIIAEVEKEVTAERENTGRMSFALNMESELRDASLLILDEVSMVSMTVGADLESFGVPILVLGDPEQLPPIFGEGYFTNSAPDILLEEIHRQALDNPIIAMSKLVREGKPLPLGNYGSSQVLVGKQDLDKMKDYDIILTGLRKTKKWCDDKYRSIVGHTTVIPKAGDKVMCVKNNHNLGLLNGQIWECVGDAVPIGTGQVILYLRDENKTEISVVAADKPFSGEKLERWEHEEGVQEFEYAYAITVHKSQGSQWNNILLFDQKDRFPNFSARDRQRWLYTGITRAAEKITVVRI
jgi:exodeoxyribonuclease-5